MCLVTNKEAEILEEDLIVYKILRITDNQIKSIFYEYTWEIDKLYEIDIKEDDDFTFFDDEDENYVDNNKFFDLKAYGQGFHSALTEKRLENMIFKNNVLAELVVPKGYIIYRGFTDLIISNKIKLIKICA